METTNTLVIYKLPKHLIDAVTQALGSPVPEGLVRWIQLGSMRRVLAVFDSPASAASAMSHFLARVKTIPGCEDSHVGFSINNIEDIANSHLKLPNPGKLWFVSPPPSPPSEWEESYEEEPNQRTHYETEFNDQLYKALKAAEESGSDSLSTPVTPVDGNRPFGPDSPRTITIIEAHENQPALQVTADDDYD